MAVKDIRLHVGRVVIHGEVASPAGGAASSLAEGIRNAMSERLSRPDGAPEPEGQNGLADAVASSVLGHRAVASRLGGRRGG
jgi:hypothetical protein